MVVMPKSIQKPPRETGGAAFLKRGGVEDFEPTRLDIVPAEPVTWDTVRRMALELPSVEEGTSYGTPALRVKGKFFARLKEDGETMVLKIGFDAREILLQSDPDVFFTTDHYAGYPSILIRLPQVDPEHLRELLEEAWRFNAPKRLADARPMSSH